MSGVLAGLWERRFHVSESPPGWVSQLAGWATATGLSVTPDKALELTDVYACVRVLAESVAMLPLVVYRRLDPRGKERASNHYLYPLLHDSPNPEMTAFSLRETLMGHVLTWGNGYAEMELDRAGGVRALWPLRPDRMKVVRKGADDLAVPQSNRGTAGALQYKYRLPARFGGREVVLPPERVFHLRGLAFDGLVGYSPIGLQRQAVALGMAAEEYAARFYENDARPGGVLKHPGKLSDPAHTRLKKSWEETHGGLKGAHRLAILEEGLEYESIGLPPEDAQFVATSQLSTVKVARMYRIPLHLIQEQERQTSWGTGIEQMNIGFVVYTLMPWLVRWEQEIAFRLLTGRERAQGLFAEHLVDGLLRGDTAQRYNAYAMGRQWGWLNADDVRELENMNPLPDGQGQEYLVPLNMIPAGSAGFGGSMERALGWDGDGLYARNQGEGGGQRIADPLRALAGGENGRDRGNGGSGPGLSPGDPSTAVGMTAGAVGMTAGAVGMTAARGVGGGARVRHRLMVRHLGLYEDVAARVLRREGNDVLNAAKRFFKRRDRAGFSDWLSGFYRDHAGFVSSQFAPLASSYGGMVLDSVVEEVGRSLDVARDDGGGARDDGGGARDDGGGAGAVDEGRMEAFVAGYVERFAERHAQVGEARVRELVERAIEAGEDPVAVLEEALAAWPETRAQETARWEAVRFGNAVALAAMLVVGVRRKVWVAFGDSCPYCLELDGMVMGIEDVFVPIGTDFQPEGAERPIHVGHSAGHPPLHDGCDCGIAAV